MSNLAALFALNNFATAVSAPVAVASVVVSGVTSLVTGTSTTLTATTKDASGNTLVGRSVTWSSSDQTNCPVNSSGLVSPTGTGSFTITATSEGIAGTLVLLVSAASSGAVASVSAGAWTTNLRVTGHLQLVPVAKDSGGAKLTGKTFTYISSDPSIATVDSVGEIIGVAAGSASIFVTCDGVSGSADLTVLPSTNVPALKAQPRTTLTYVSGASTLHCDAALSRIPSGTITTEQFDLYTGRPGYGGTLVTSSGSLAFGTGHDFTGLADNHLAWVRCTVGDGANTDTTDLFSPVETPAVTPWAYDQFDSGDFSYTSPNGFSWGGGSNIVPELSRFGAYSKRFTLAGMFGQWATSDWAWAEARFTIGGEHKEIWFEFWTYFPDGTEGLGSAAYRHRNGPTSDNNKFLQVWGGGSQANENSLYYVKFLHETEVSTAAPSGSEYMGFKYGTNAALGGKVVSNYQFNGQTSGANPVTDVSKDIGMWHCHRFWMKVSDIGLNNGAEKYWLDGVLKVNATGLANAPADGDPAKGYMYGYIQGWPNSGYDEKTYTYWGSIAIFTSDPGWT